MCAMCSIVYLGHILNFVSGSFQIDEYSVAECV